MCAFSRALTTLQVNETTLLCLRFDKKELNHRHIVDEALKEKWSFRLWQLSKIHSNSTTTLRDEVIVERFRTKLRAWMLQVFNINCKGLPVVFIKVYIRIQKTTKFDMILSLPTPITFELSNHQKNWRPSSYILGLILRTEMCCQFA